MPDNNTLKPNSDNKTKPESPERSKLSGQDAKTIMDRNRILMEQQQDYDAMMHTPVGYTEDHANINIPDSTGGYGTTNDSFANTFTPDNFSGTSRQEGSINPQQSGYEYAGTSNQEGSINPGAYINQNLSDAQREHDEFMYKPEGYTDNFDSGFNGDYGTDNFADSHNYDFSDFGNDGGSYDSNPSPYQFKSPFSSGSSYDMSGFNQAQHSFDDGMHNRPLNQSFPHLTSSSGASGFSGGASSGLNIGFGFQDYTADNVVADRVGTLVQSGGRILVVDFGFRSFQRKAESTGELGSGLAIIGSAAIDVSHLAKYHAKKMMYQSGIRTFERQYGNYNTAWKKSSDVLKKEGFKGFRNSGAAGSAVNKYSNLKKQRRYVDKHSLSFLQGQQARQAAEMADKIRLTNKKLSQAKAGSGKYTRLYNKNIRQNAKLAQINTKKLKPMIFSQNAATVNKSLEMQQKIAGNEMFNPGKRYSLLTGALAMQVVSTMRRYAQQDDAMKGMLTINDVRRHALKVMKPAIKLVQSVNRQIALVAKRAMLHAAQIKLSTLRSQYAYARTHNPAAKNKAHKKIVKQRKKISGLRDNRTFKQRVHDFRRKYNPFLRLKDKFAAMIRDKVKDWAIVKLLDLILSPIKNVLIAIKEALHTLFMFLLKVAAVIVGVVIIISFIFWIFSAAGGIFNIFGGHENDHAAGLKKALFNCFKDDMKEFERSGCKDVTFRDYQRDSDLYLQYYDEFKGVDKDDSASSTDATSTDAESDEVNIKCTSNFCEIMAMAHVWYGFDLQDGNYDDQEDYVTKLWYASHRAYRGDGVYYTTYFNALFDVDWQNASAGDVWSDEKSPASSVYATTTGNIALMLYRNLYNDLGLTKEATVAIIANLDYQTDGFDDDKLYKLDSDGNLVFGLGGWKDDRYTDFKDYCDTNGFDYTKAEGQVAFFKEEVKGSSYTLPWINIKSENTYSDDSINKTYYKSFSDFKSLDDSDGLEFATKVFYYCYVHPSDNDAKSSSTATQTIIKKANEWYDKLDNLSMLDNVELITQYRNGYKGRGLCTPTAICNMLRRYYYLTYGDDAYKQIYAMDENGGRCTTYVPNGPTSNTFTLNGHQISYTVDDNVVGNESKLQSLLSQHPEGIMVYDQYQPHGVLMTRYDESTKTYYIVDTGSNDCKEIMYSGEDEIALPCSTLWGWSSSKNVDVNTFLQDGFANTSYGNVGPYVAYVTE